MELTGSKRLHQRLVLIIIAAGVAERKIWHKKARKILIICSLFVSSPNIKHIMSKLLQRLDCEFRDIFVRQDPHGVRTTPSSGVTCSSASEAA